MLEQLTLFPEDSLVNPTQAQENDLVKTTLDISGQKCLESFQKFDRVGLWAKTFAALLIGTEGWYSMKCRLNWKLKATKSHRFYFQLVPSTLPIEETEFGLLPTPRTTDIEGGLVKNVQMQKGSYFRQNKNGIKWGVKLRDVVENRLLPTPKVGGKEGYQSRAKRQGHEKAMSHLEAFVDFHNQMLPTPMASDCGDKVTGLETQDSLTKRARETTGQTSQLSPQFVMEMMGFPTDWTELPFLNGETNQSKQEETQSCLK
jgi:hypothetical protein